MEDTKADKPVQNAAPAAQKPKQNQGNKPKQNQGNKPKPKADKPAVTTAGYKQPVPTIDSIDPEDVIDDEAPQPDLPDAPTLKKRAPQIKKRGDAEFTMHLFEADAADTMKNKAFRPGEVDLTRWPHKHFFRTRNERGQKTEFSTSQNGHFHRMHTHDPETGEQYLDAEGYPAVKCGPPLRKIEVRVGSKLVDKIVRCWFEETHVEHNEEDDEHMLSASQASTRRVYDNHVHLFRYQSTETFTTKSFAEMRKEAAESIAAEIPPGARAISTAPPELTAKDGLTMGAAGARTPDMR